MQAKNKRKKKWNRHEFTAKLLECLVEQSLTYKALMMAFLQSSGSGYLMNKHLRKEMRESEREYHAFLEKQRFYNLLSKLKREGLIEANNDKCSLTQSGKEKFKKIIGKIFPKSNYKKEKSDQINIVTYDISEKDRHKRNWLRLALKTLGFYLLQDSVWISKTKLPAQFIKDLEEISILSKVHIFTVSQEGTLHKYPINLD